MKNLRVWKGEVNAEEWCIGGKKLYVFFSEEVCGERPLGMRRLAAMGAALRLVSDWEMEIGDFPGWHFHRGCTGNAERRNAFSRASGALREGWGARKIGGGGGENLPGA